MQSAPIELRFKQLADGQLGLLRARLPLDCSGSAQAMAGSALVARLNGDPVAELCTGAARFTRRPGAEPRQIGLLWQLGGRSELSQGEGRALLEAGDWAVFDPDQAHEINVGERGRLLLMWTSASRFDTGASGWQRLAARRLLTGGGPAQVALAALGALLRSGSALSAQSGATLHEAVLGLLCRALGEALEAHGLAPKAARERGVDLAQLQAHVRENLARADLGPDQLAAAFGISRRSVYKLFEPLGVTPHQFIQSARLDRALELLGDPAWRGVPIAGIGRHCGFADAAHFSKAFRARTGVAPTIFREAAVI